MNKILTIYVRSSTRTNKARIACGTLRASCMSSPQAAAIRVARKLFRKQSFSLVCEVEPRVLPPRLGRYIAAPLKQ